MNSFDIIHTQLVAFNISYLSVAAFDSHCSLPTNTTFINSKTDWERRREKTNVQNISKNIVERNMCQPKCLGDSDLNAKLRDICRKTIFHHQQFPPLLLLAVYPRCQCVHTFRTCSILILRHIRLYLVFSCLSICL